MNRIQPCATADFAPEHLDIDIEQARMQSTERRGVHQSLFTPLHYEPNYAYPLFIWMHGPGDNEHQIKRIMPLVSMRNYVAVAPRGNTAEDAAQGRYRWEQTSTGIMAAEQSVRECIEYATERFHVDRSRVFLAGFDCGGTMALRLGMKLPELFAGILSVGGPFPVSHQPLLDIDRARQVPLLISHGRDSQKYPVDQVCADLRLFHSAGMKVTLRQYPCGDEITTKILSDLDAWTMERVTGVAADQDDHSLFRAGELN